MEKKKKAKGWERYYKHFPNFQDGEISKEKIVWKNNLIKRFSELEKSVEKNKDIDELFYSFYSFSLICGHKLSKSERSVIVKDLIHKFLNDEISYEMKIRIANLIHKLNKRYDVLNVGSIDWKPFYDLYRKVKFPKKRSLTKLSPPKHFISSLESLIEKIRRYFDPKYSAIEIFTTFKENYCPFSLSHANVPHNMVTFLSVFMPTRKEFFSDSFKLTDFIEELFAMWNYSGNVKNFSKSAMTKQFMKIFASLAENQIGNINWNVYSDLMFNKMLKLLNLSKRERGNGQFGLFKMLQSLMSSHGFPGGGRGRGGSGTSSSIASIILWMISPEYIDKTMRNLNMFLKSIGFFCHPDNEGGKTTEIAVIFKLFSKYLSNRINYERKEYCKIDKKHVISKEIIERIVDLLLPISKRLLFCKYPQNSAIAADLIKDLSHISTKQTLDFFMDDIIFALNTNLQTHQTSPSLVLLSTIIYPMLQNKKSFPNSIVYLEKILYSSLQSFDINKGFSRAMAGMMFWGSLFGSVKFFSKDEVDREKKGIPRICEGLDDWCIIFLQKIFDFLKNSTRFVKNADKMGGAMRGKGGNRTVGMITEIAGRFISSLSDGLYKIISKKIMNFVRTNCLPDISDALGSILSCASYRSNDPGKSLKPFIDLFYEKLIGKNKKLKENMSEKEKKYYLSMLKQMLKHNPGVKDNISKIKEILTCCWNEDKKEIVIIVGGIVKNVLRSLGTMYPLRFDNSEMITKKINAKEEVNKWGKLYDIDDINVKWHTPSEEEMKIVADLYNYVIKEPYSSLKSYVSVSNKDANVLFLSLYKIKSILKGMSLIFPNISNEVIEIYSTNKFPMDKNVIKTGRFTINNDKLSVKKYDIAMLINNIANTLLQNTITLKDVEVTELLIKTIYSIFNKRLVNFGEIYMTKASINRKFNKLMKKDHFPKYFHRYSIEIMCNGRKSLKDFAFCKVHDNLLKDNIIKFIQSPFAKIRMTAQNKFIQIAKNISSKVLKVYMLKMFSTVNNYEKDDNKPTNEQCNGIIHLFNDQFIKTQVLNDVDILKEYFTMICTINPKKETIQKRISILFTQMNKFLEQNLSYLNTKHVKMLINHLFNILFTLENGRGWKIIYTTLRSILVLMRKRSNEQLFDIKYVKYLLEKAVVSTNIFVNDTAFKILCFYFEKIKPKVSKKKVSFSSHKQFVEALKSIPTNQNEWNKTLFFDKDYIGWDPSTFKKGKEKEFKCCDYEKDIKSGTESIVVKEIKEILLKDDAKWFDSIVYVLKPKPKLSLYISEFFKGIFQVVGIDFFKVIIKNKLLSIALDKIGSGKERENICVTLSILGGLIRGMKHISNYNDRAEIIKFCTNLIETIIEKASYPNVYNDLSAFVMSSFTSHDVRRSIWFASMLQSVLDIDCYARSVKNVKVFKLLNLLYNIFSWRDVQIGEKIIPKVLKNLTNVDHDLQFRNVIAVFLYNYLLYNWSNARDSDKENVLVMYNNDIKCDNKRNDGVLKRVIGEYGDVIKKNDEKNVKKMSQIVGKCFNILITDYSAARYVGKEIIPIIISLCNSNEKETQEFGRDMYKTLSNCFFGPIEIVKDIFLSLQSSISKIKLFQNRLEAVKCFYLFVYNHLFYISNSKQLNDIVFNTLCNLFIDESMEIREFAMKCLSEYIMNSNIKLVVKDFTNNLIKDAKKLKKLCKKKKGKDLDMNKVHIVVLSLASVVRAYPYDVIKEFTPQVLMLLVFFSYYNLGNFIKKIVNSTFLVFKKTHKDNWEKHKKMFTEEQLDDIKEVGSSASYYV